MKTYLVFKIQGESDIIEPVGKLQASTAQDAIKQSYNIYKDDWFDNDFMFNDEWTIDDAMADGGITGGEDSALFGYLPEMADSWVVTSETEYAVLAVEEMQLISAIMKSIKNIVS